MLKLFTIEELSAFSSDALYKICLTLEDYGLRDENVSSFESYEALFNAVSYALTDGDDVIVAAENSDYNAVKHILLGKLQLEEITDPDVENRIAQNRGAMPPEENAAAHCASALGAVCHLSADGWFSGLTMPSGSGSLTLVPLDFSRIDAVLDSYIAYAFGVETDDTPLLQSELIQPELQETQAQMDLVDPVAQMTQALLQASNRLCLVHGEATDWIYDLRGTVDDLSDVVDFAQPVSQTQNTAGVEESASAKLLRQAKDARRALEVDYGAAISPVFTTEGEDAKVYYAYVAVADREGAKAKRINTTNPDDLPLLLPHCVVVLCDTVCKKIEAKHAADEAEDTPQKPDDKKVSKGFLAFAAVILLVAIAVPLLLLHNYLNNDDTTGSAAPGTSGYVSTINFNTTDTPTSGGLPADNYLKPAEPGASEVSAATTASVTPSTAGTFTFYVFGYGHGVGLSQHGAEYLAKQGWDYAQILANYYYGTTLVSGDTYPATINYAGTDYPTRDYIASVLESEMSGSFSKEALKAQAVAVYTFAKYNGFRLNADANAHGKTPSAICTQVADEVASAGLYLAYQGKTALTPFHSISAGKTTSYYNVWGGTQLPYLEGGRPSYGDYEVVDFKSTYTISSDEFRAIASSKLNVELTGDPATWIRIVTHDQAVSNDIGYVSTISIGGKEITGNEFRCKVMEGRIRSHCFMLAYTPTA